MSTGADPAVANARALERHLAWLGEVLHARLATHFGQPGAQTPPEAMAPPDLAGDDSELAQLIVGNRLDWAAQVILMLALAPHVQPQILDPLFLRNANIDRGFTEFGGWKGKAHAGFLPTGETAAFLAAGDAIQARALVRRLFDDAHPFARQAILRLEHDAPGEPFFSGALTLSSEALARLTTGEKHKPDFSTSFPAKLLTTQLDWNDLVLSPEVRVEIDVLLGWIRHSRTILDTWGLGRAVTPGYRSLFFGPPGTGKTLTATLLGKEVGADVYRIDLSMVVSKYIGETEKNLAAVFDVAERARALLLFDEADALFGKRTDAQDAHDRYANMETAYLLQRLERYEGVAVLTTNLRGQLDKAFTRRFEAIVEFAEPDAAVREALWRLHLPEAAPLAPDVNLRELAEWYAIAGAQIKNAALAAAFLAASGQQRIAQRHFLWAIEREFDKAGRAHPGFPPQHVPLQDIHDTLGPDPDRSTA